MNETHLSVFHFVSNRARGKRFRNSVSSADCEVQRRIEREVRIREGASKLLAACSQRDQALEASKTLLTSNSRILALMTQLQRMKEAQAMLRAGRRSSDGESVDKRLPCTGKVAISDIRIPLMWKDSEYFKNKGELHRCAVFYILHLLSFIPLIFMDKMEMLYSCCVEEEFSMGFSTLRLSRLGSASSKKFMATLETAASCSSHSSGAGSPGGESPVLLPALSVRGPKYHLLAHTSLTLCHVQNSFRTHDLTISDTEGSSFWLPLYGNICCRLVAQPLCMTQVVMCGKLRIRVCEYNVLL
uniref:Rhotekin-like n=1 Tax=Sinocyclocheilus rhinocerous TaxID=307959 RepID=A0A673IEB3_9TELE